MSGYILCQVKKAEKPFYIENISTNIYSIEELCYYLYNNLYLVDSSLISSKLCTWLEEEIGMPELAGKLRDVIRMRGSVEKFVTSKTCGEASTFHWKRGRSGGNSVSDI